MNRAVTWIVLLTAIGAATGVFLLKNQVQSLEAALIAERSATRAEFKAIEVLEAEWSYLNNPDRLARLAAHHLQLAPLTPAQTLPIEAIPVRATVVDGAPGIQLAPLVPVPRMKPTLATAKGQQ